MIFKKGSPFIKFLILAAALFLSWYLGKAFHIDALRIEKLLHGVPLFYSGILYIILYVVITFFIFFSKDIFWLAGAVLFGPFFSTLFICVAETINAFILFYLARCLGRAYVEKTLTEKYKNLDERLSKISFFWLFIFRASPLIPYRFLDLAAGLTKINFKKYLAAVVFGSPVKIFWLQYILSAVGKSIFDNPYALIEYFLKNRAIFFFSFIYIIFIILVVLKISRKD